MLREGRKYRFWIALLVVAALLFSGRLSAQDTSVQESKKAALEKEISQLKKLIDDNNKLTGNALAGLDLLRSQIAARKKLVAESDREIAALKDSVKRVEARANALEERLDTLSSHYSRLVRSAYKNRDARIWYIYVLSSRDFAQASRRYAYFRSLSSQMSSSAAKIKETQSSLKDEKAHLSEMLSAADKLREERRSEVERLSSEQARSDKMVTQLKRNKTKYQKQLSTKKKQVEALNKQIEKIIAQYVAENSKKSSGSGSSKSSAAVDYKLASEFESNKGRLPWPADGPIVEKFGRHSHPVYKSIEMPFSNGISIGLPANSEVKAVFNGEVRRVIVMPGYNKCVLVQHGNYFTFYCKLGEVKVKAGDKVTTGQTLGLVDTIDGQTQLHLQVWKEKTPQNPESWLRPK